MRLALPQTCWSVFSGLPRVAFCPENMGLESRRRIIKGCLGSVGKKKGYGGQTCGLNISLSSRIMTNCVSDVWKMESIMHSPPPSIPMFVGNFKRHSEGVISCFLPTHSVGGVLPKSVTSISKMRLQQKFVIWKWKWSDCGDQARHSGMWVPRQSYT